MPTFDVHFVRLTNAVVTVEAEFEDDAIERAYEHLPSFSAHEAGWGDKYFSADADEWMTPDEYFYDDYSEDKYGPVVEEVE
jgi:hypothetical protein